MKLAVYNLLGQQVEVLREGVLSAGTHVEYWNAAHFASGEYFVKLEAGKGITEVRKVVMVR
ncbi:T9SS type A sorting domain-containing protein [bacterium]|nr:T9SS type A sorting domain-containing protein [bacterium]